MSPLIRYAAPTAQPTNRDGGASEGRADPHGIHWTRGAPPLDCASYAAPSAVDLVAASVARHTDSLGTGAGVGRRASGFQMLTAGTVTIVTGANQTETFQGATLPQGYSVTVEILTITSSGTVLVTW